MRYGIRNNLMKIVLQKVGQVETGRFAEHMEVELINDGPITLILER